jgi:hypothetical protein
MRILHLLYHQLRYNPLLIFALGAVAGGTVEYYIGELIDAYGLWAPLSIVAGAVLAGAGYLGLVQLVRRLAAPPAINMGRRPDPARGLILLLGGRSRETAPKACEVHQATLERVWLVVTDLTAAVAVDLEHQWPGVRCHRQEVENQFNPVESAGALRRAVDHARTLGLPVEALICDVTGGTTAMTVGAMHGCLAAGVRMQMVPGSYDEALRAFKAHEPIELRLV